MSPFDPRRKNIPFYKIIENAKLAHNGSKDDNSLNKPSFINSEFNESNSSEDSISHKRITDSNSTEGSLNENSTSDHGVSTDNNSTDESLNEDSTSDNIVFTDSNSTDESINEDSTSDNFIPNSIKTDSSSTEGIQINHRIDSIIVNISINNYFNNPYQESNKIDEQKVENDSQIPIEESHLNSDEQNLNLDSIEIDGEVEN